MIIMSTIYKLGVLLAVLLSSLFGTAQSKSDQLYDMFSGNEGVATLSFAKSVIKPLELFIDDDTKKVIYKMKKVRFLSYNQEKGKFQADEVYNRMLKTLSGGQYFEIDPKEIKNNDCHIHIDDDGDQIKLIGQGKKDKMDEFHLVLRENNNTLIFSFFGDITVEDLKAFGKFSCSTKNMVNF